MFENGGNLKKKDFDKIGAPTDKIGAPTNKKEFTKGGMGNSSLVKDSTTRENQTVLKNKILTNESPEKDSLKILSIS